MNLQRKHLRMDAERLLYHRALGRLFGGLLVAVAVISMAKADTWVPPPQYVVNDSHRQAFFVMLISPDKHGRNGVAYRVESDGSFSELWSVSGWYAATTFLVAGGRHLVRIGNRASMRPEQQLAVAFYDEGELVQSYRVADLLDDVDSIEPTVSHYLWQRRTDDFPRLSRYKSRQFQLLTIEGRVYTFDVATGDVIETRLLSGEES